MAFFERGDERDQLIVCNICDVKCAERSITNHRYKCADRHADKFKTGKLVRCNYDSGHIVEADKLSLHLEFCIKRQNDLKAEYQREIAAAQTIKSISPDSTGKDTEPTFIQETSLVDPANDWNLQTDRDPFVARMSRLKLK